MVVWIAQIRSKGFCCVDGCRSVFIMDQYCNYTGKRSMNLRNVASPIEVTNLF
jgi:hypothetical protein